MNTINIKDIDLSKLKKLNSQGTKSTLYEYNDKCIKILDGLYDSEKISLYRKFRDMDGCKFGNHSSQFISLLMKSLIIDYRKEKIHISRNLDNISMLISMFYLLYLKEIQTISKRNYNSLANNIKTLENSRKYANILIDKNNYISSIPYLDELIDDNDNYIIDRYKQLTLSKKISYLLRRK